MRLVICILVALWANPVTPSWGQRTHAAPAISVETADRQVRALEERVAGLGASQRELETRYQKLAADITSLKKQRRSWNSDRQLRELLATSKTMADRLARGQRQLATARQELAAARRQLVAALDRAIATSPALSLVRLRLAGLRKFHATQLAPSRKKLSVTDVRVDPLDDPEDLVHKAELLGDSEAELLREADRMQSRSQYYARRGRLERGRQRAGDADIFGEGPRRRSVRSDTAGAAAGEADNQEVPSVGGAPAADPDPSPAPPAPAQPDAPPAQDLDDTGAELIRVYADVVAPETLSALESADRSGSPRDQARAAARAADDLRERAARLRATRAALLERARRLRE